MEQAREAKSDAPRPSVARRILRALVIVLVVGAVVGALGVVVIVKALEADLPSVSELKQGYSPPQVTRVYARDGTLLANVFLERRTVIPLSEVPDHVRLAFLAAEDAGFYDHEGLDYFGMLRALAANVRAGRTVQGGSTITQQVIKNVLLSPERSYRRKMKETILARRVEQHLTKDEIFAMYLNHIYLGHGRYGVEEASRHFFGKKTRELDLAEGAALAGIVASPERYSPRTAPDKALSRRRYVLEQMLAKGFVTRAVYEEALRAPLRVAPASEADSALAPEVVDGVKSILREVAGDAWKLGGFEVKTTIEPGMQAAARKAVRENLDRYMTRQKLAPPYTLSKRRTWGAPFHGTPAKHHIYVGVVDAVDDEAKSITLRVGDARGRVLLSKEERYNPAQLAPTAFTAVGAVLRVAILDDADDDGLVPLRLELAPQGALVAIDPRTRHVLALVGGYDALPGGLDRARYAKRQPGSAFKPIVYSYAMNARLFTPATVLAIPQKGGEPDAGAGPRRISVRTALAKSDNDAAVHLLEQCGPVNVVQWAAALGIESRLDPNLSLALGAYEVTPLELANAYATIASGGEYATPVLIVEITGPDKKLIPLPTGPPARRVMDADAAYLATSLMASVVQTGTGRRALEVGRPIAGKTGTTNDAKDAWFVGFSTEVVTSSWVGFDDAVPLGWGEQGAVTALPAFVDFMKAAHVRRPVGHFLRPAAVRVVKIDPATGLLPYEGQTDAVDEEFLAGTEPVEHASQDAGEDSGDGTADAGRADASTKAADAGAAPAPSASFATTLPLAPSASAPAPSSAPSAEPPLF